MSIQSSMNALLGSGALLAKFAEPNVNATLLSREKEKEYDKIKGLTSSFNPDNFADMPTEDQISTIEQNLRDFGLETDYQSDYIDSLTRIHESSPGNKGVLDRLNKAKELSPEMNEANKRISAQIGIVRREAESQRIDADDIEKKMKERGDKISLKGQDLGRAKIAKARAMENAFNALDERYNDILQQNIAARKGVSQDIIQRAMGRTFKDVNSELRRSLARESAASWEVNKKNG